MEQLPNHNDPFGKTSFLRHQTYKIGPIPRFSEIPSSLAVAAPLSGMNAYSLKVKHVETMPLRLAHAKNRLLGIV